MRILEVEQGTDEWLAARAGMVTASNFGKVLAKGQGKTRKGYMLQCLAERMTGRPAESFTTAAMEWGTEHEAQARANYELMVSGVEVREVGMVFRDDDVSCSPDGLVGKSGMLEIKCPNTVTHIETILSGKVPPQYLPQVQGGMWVAEREWCDFVSFDPRMSDEGQMFVVRVKRDYDYIKTLEDEVAKFVTELQGLEDKLGCPRASMYVPPLEGATP